MARENLEVAGAGQEVRLRGSFANKKTIAEGTLDLTLLAVNALQLYDVMKLKPDGWGITVGFIGTSLALQFMVACLLICSGKKNTIASNRMENLCLILVVTILLLNVFIYAYLQSKKNPDGTFNPSPADPHKPSN